MSLTEIAQKWQISLHMLLLNRWFNHEVFSRGLGVGGRQVFAAQWGLLLYSTVPFCSRRKPRDPSSTCD